MPKWLQLGNAMHCSPSAYRSECCLTHSKAITYRPQGQCCSKRLPATCSTRPPSALGGGWGLADLSSSGIIGLSPFSNG